MKTITLQKRLQDTFIDLIKIDEIFEEEKEVIAYVTRLFEELRIPIKQDAYGNLIGYYPGKGEPIMLNTHLDIPENVPHLDYKIEGNIIRATGKSILGADPKSGLAILLELARYLKEHNIQTHPIEFVFTRGEEAGLKGASNLDYSLISSKMGLVIDEDGPFTHIVTRAPGYYRIDVEIEGKIVHPRDWRDGINSLTIAARAIAKIKQGEIVKGVTCNIGLFKSGTARNTVPGITTFKAELRSFDMKKLKDQGEKFENILRKVVKNTGAKLTIDSKIEFESYQLKKQHPLFKKLEHIYKHLHTKPNYYETYGGSDANIFNAKGIKAVPIGSAYYLAHQYEEYVNLDDMEQLLFFLLHFVSSEI